MSVLFWKMHKDLLRRAALAQQETGRSVVALAPANNPGGIPFGVKNTKTIPYSIVKKITADPRYTWLTIDKMSDKGRSVDTDLVNPITYRLMTGSTSGGPINILKGITEFCIGTDGGGSVLGPAAAVNLFSFIGPGLIPPDPDGKASVSTDNISFSPSVGIIGKSPEILRDIYSLISELDLSPEGGAPCRIALPGKGQVTLPDGIDMRQKLNPYREFLEQYNYTFIDTDYTGIDDRTKAISVMRGAFENGADIILSAEGPVDVVSYDETILHSFKGSVPAMLTGRGGKYFIKAANMAGSPALSFPTDEPASALIICGRPGLAGAKKVLHTASILNEYIQPAPLFKRYFLDQEKKNEGFVFDE